MLLFSFTFFLFSVHEGLSSVWSYHGPNGPNHWASLFPVHCDGNKQSPINIDTQSLIRNYADPFVFRHYEDLPASMTINNNGHSAVVSITGSPTPYIKKGGLHGSYEVAQFHFHWGNDDLQGSEHTINGVSYPMEMHIVHFKSSYGDLTTALEHPDGVAVLGFMFEISATANPAFAPLVAALANIPNYNDVDTVIPAYPLSAFIPNGLSSFYRYKGSLTTPNCNEAVIWTVFKEIIPISDSQLAGFRALFDSDSNPMVDNYRPTQPLNGRNVFDVGTQKKCIIYD